MNEKIKNGINKLIFHYGYFAEILLSCNIVENNSESMPTMCVYCKRSGFVLEYNNSFVDRHTQEEINFILMHEAMHILSNHEKRVRDGQLNPELSNIAQDGVINSGLLDSLKKDSKTELAEMPSSGIVVPEKFSGLRISELLYVYLIDNNEELTKENDRLGLNGKYGFDEHKEDEVPYEMREAMSQEIIDKIRTMGLGTADFENMLKTIRAPSINYLDKIKSAINSAVGKIKYDTWFKPSRRSELSKGKKKKSKEINVILDTSGSMGGNFENVLSYIFYNDITINLIQCDTEIKEVSKIKSKAQLQKTKVRGFGGTHMEKAVNYIAENLNNFPTIFLTDGLVPDLDVSKLNNDFIVLYTERKIKTVGGNVKQFKINSKR